MYSRRHFLQTAVLIAASVSLIGKGHHLRRKQQCISFAVAGSRYFPDLPALCTGQLVNLVKGLFNGEICYRVVTSSGETIGYVPKQNLEEVSWNHNRCWVLTFSDPNALPWKRYIVSCS